MTIVPSWLPALFKVSPWDHNTFDLLHEIFHRDFISSPVCYEGHKVRQYSYELEDGKEKSFWHLTTREDGQGGVRLPDLRRSERLPWLKNIIENASHSDILTWESTEGDGVIKIYVWLKDHDYVAIMKKPRQGALILLTAHWLEYPNAKKKLMKKYNSRNGKANA
ncbi:MAG: hypothetical protein P4M14_01075 [Gammaproteobacteria bacterium]|nr:hypothetical protein [Gammaproteobacteria bacterium]